jgi:hypothetical protein
VLVNKVEVIQTEPGLAEYRLSNPELTGILMIFSELRNSDTPSFLYIPFLEWENKGILEFDGLFLNFNAAQENDGFADALYQMIYVGKEIRTEYRLATPPLLIGKWKIIHTGVIL